MQLIFQTKALIFSKKRNECEILTLIKLILRYTQDYTEQTIQHLLNTYCREMLPDLLCQTKVLCL